MLSSLILSLVVSASPAVESTQLNIEEAGTRRNQVRIDMANPEALETSTRHNQVRIDMVNPEALEAGTRRNQVRIGTRRNQVRI